MAKAAQERTTTDYVVLKKWDGLVGGDNRDLVLWHVIGEAAARSKREAIKLVAKDEQGAMAGKFKAVSASGWKGGLSREVEMVEKVIEAEIDDEALTPSSVLA